MRPRDTQNSFQTVPFLSPRPLLVPSGEGARLRIENKLSCSNIYFLMNSSAAQTYILILIMIYSFSLARN